MGRGGKAPPQLKERQKAAGTTGHSFAWAWQGFQLKSRPSSVSYGQQGFLSETKVELDRRGGPQQGGRW